MEQDDEWIEKYLEGEEPDAATLKQLIRKGALAMEFFPMLCGSAFKNKGVQPMLDAVVDYMPAPTDVEAINVRSPPVLTCTAHHCAGQACTAYLPTCILTDGYVMYSVSREHRAWP